MDNDVVVSMYRYILHGGAKETCPFVRDDESSAIFDSIAAEVAANPGAIWDVPSEMP
jgi:hypothetical protein